MTLTAPLPTRFERPETPRPIGPGRGSTRDRRLLRQVLWWWRVRWLLAAQLGSTALNGAYNATSPSQLVAQIGADLIKAHTSQAGAAAPGTATVDVVSTSPAAHWRPEGGPRRVGESRSASSARSAPSAIPSRTSRRNGQVPWPPSHIRTRSPSSARRTSPPWMPAVAPVRHLAIRRYAGDLGKARAAGGPQHQRRDRRGRDCARILLLTSRQRPGDAASGDQARWSECRRARSARHPKRYFQSPANRHRRPMRAWRRDRLRAVPLDEVPPAHPWMARSPRLRFEGDRGPAGARS